MMSDNISIEEISVDVLDGEPEMIGDDVVNDADQEIWVSV